ncbi:MAG TPA: M48 family metalloprotease [Desulfobacterales bacterium]|nr:M48 family metalloprotease [Desulfobacterales bacterium]
MKFVRKFFAICAAFFFISGVIFPPDTLGITVKEEEELSREFLKVVLRNFKLIEDSLTTSYVNKIGAKIVSVLPSQPFAYQFYIVDEYVYNAFATPAGHIFINRGLLEAMENEEELAGILSHEIAHVLCRHISQKIERSKKIAIATLAGLAAGIFLGAAAGSGAASAVTVGSMAAGQSAELAYSREDEMQADQIGLRYLAKAGYEGTGLLTILKKIRGQEWFGSDQIPHYVKTHPAIEDRIAYIDSWIEANLKEADKNRRVPSYDFDRFHTRLISNYGEKEVAIGRFKAEVNGSPSDQMANYGYGLALARMGNRKDAVFYLKTALEKNAFDYYLLTDLGRIYFLDGRYREATRTLENAISVVPNNLDGLFYLGRSQMGLGKFAEAESTFESLLTINGRYAPAFYFLGEACGRQGKMADAHFYLGIYYKNKGEWKTAAFHLNRALRDMKDPEKELRIKEILKEIHKESPKS